MRYNHLDMLPIKAFQPVGKRMTLEGGGGDSGGSQTSTSYSTNLPEYAKPYYQELLKQTGKNIFNTDTRGFVTGVKGAGELPEQQRIGMTGLQQQGIQGIGNLSAPSQFSQSTQGLGTGQQLGYGTAMAGLNQAFSYNPNSAEKFGGAAADYYMNPYQQNVTNTALREAAQRGQIDKQAGAMGAIGRGTFGGARQALIQAEQGRGLNQQLADIQYKGASDAYQNAQQQFNADEQRRQQAQQYASTLGAQIGQTGMGAGLDASKALGALGSEQQQADLARLQAQVAAGDKQQAQMQGEADVDYQNRMAKLNYEKQQLQFYSDILRGNAGALGSTSVQYAPGPSQASQVAGLGIAGLGLAKALG
jgi:hypothetical protein